MSPTLTHAPELLSPENLRLRRQKGFTFLHILALVALVGIAALLITRFVSGLVIEEKAMRTTLKIRQLHAGIYSDRSLFNTPQKFFLGDVLRLPTHLHELVANDHADPNWDGPYWSPETPDGGFPDDSVDVDAFGRQIGWSNTTGKLILADETRVAITSRLGVHGLADIEAMLTPGEAELEKNLTGHIIGTVRDTTGHTFPHPWHRQKVLLQLQYLGNAYIPVDINLPEEREIFRQHYHGFRFDRVHPEGDIETEDTSYDFSDTGIPVLKKVGNNNKITLVFNEYWTGHDHPGGCPFRENDDALSDLVASFNYLSLPWHYTTWYNHLRADHMGLDGASVPVGTIKHTQGDWASGYNLTIAEMQNLITVHPEVDGRYYFDDVPVGNYIITAYDHYLLRYLSPEEQAQLPSNLHLAFKRVDTALKRYIAVLPNHSAQVHFRFTDYFPGHTRDTMADSTAGTLQANFLTYTAASWTIDNMAYTALSLGNSHSSTSITMTDLDVYWENTAPNQKAKLQAVMINGNTVWTGNQNSIAALNIVDTTLPPGTFGIPVLLQYNSTDDHGGNVQLVITFSDASAAIVYDGGTLMF